MKSKPTPFPRPRSSRRRFLVAGREDRPGKRRHDGRAFGGEDVLALVQVAVARRAEHVFRPAEVVDARNREHGAFCDRLRDVGTPAARRSPDSGQRSWHRCGARGCLAGARRVHRQALDAGCGRCAAASCRDGRGALTLSDSCRPRPSHATASDDDQRAPVAPSRGSRDDHRWARRGADRDLHADVRDARLIDLQRHIAGAPADVRHVTR